MKDPQGDLGNVLIRAGELLGLVREIHADHFRRAAEAPGLIPPFRESLLLFAELRERLAEKGVIP